VLEQSPAMKIVIVLGFVAVLAALGAAGVFMLRRGPSAPADASVSRQRMARALAVRVGVSVAIFLFLMLGYLLGWITPTGLPVGR